MKPLIRIGTRGSALALVQAHLVQATLGEHTTINIYKTTGDKRQDLPLDLVTGVGLFTKELERALLANTIDLAVHSLKDLPVAQPDGLSMGAIPERAPAADLILIRPDALDLSQKIPIRLGATLGTSSTRRRVLAAEYRPDLIPVNLRGNVPTRLRKCIDGECDALILAHAGLHRLGADLSPLVAFELNPRMWPCAPGQGALGLETRTDDVDTLSRVQEMEHPPTRAAITAERGLLELTGGGCHSAFGAWANIQNDFASVTIALHDDTQGFRRAHFSATDLTAAVINATAWLQAGAPALPSNTRTDKEWLCRTLPASS
jgi:hydroxymethylbilane synthase